MSTYLQYNNHMILHPTDRTKYFYGIAGDPPEPPGPTFDEVTIGSQTWMAKNLSIDDGQGGIITQIVNYGEVSVTEYYYTWNAAVRVAASIDGWHLPTMNEWNTLITTVDGHSVASDSVAGSKLKSTYGWYNGGNGTDNYGFTALPTGKHVDDGFENANINTNFWSATPHSPTSSESVEMTYYLQRVDLGQDDNEWMLSVRLVKD